MPYATLALVPGVDTIHTPTANVAGLAGSNLIRSNQNTIEKLGGWKRLIDTPCAGYARAMHAWKDLSLANNLLLGTDIGAQLLSDTVLVSLSLVLRSSSLTRPWFAMNAGSNMVTVTESNHGLSVGTILNIQTTAVGDSAGWFAGSAGTTALYDITKTGGIVAVGFAGAVQTSPDGAAWTARASGVGTSLYGVAWSGSLYVAVGDSGTIITSPDGISWTSRTSSSSSSLRGVVWANSQWVVVGLSGTILTSPDGVNWTTRASGTGENLFMIAWSGTLLCSVGSNSAILTSTDGVNWTSRSSAISGASWAGVAYGNGVFCVCGTALSSAGAVQTSTDGISWVSRSLPTIAPTMTLYDVAWSGTMFCICGSAAATLSSSNEAEVITSADGVTWEHEPSNVPVDMIGVRASGSVILAVGLGGSTTIRPTTTTVQTPRIAPGTYTIASVPNSNTYTFAGQAAALSTTQGGVLPLYTANGPGFSNNRTVRVYLQNHNLSVGQTFNVNLYTQVNNIGLSGPYSVTRVPNAWTFDIAVPSIINPGFTRTFENGGAELIQYFAATPTVPQNWFLDNLGENGLVCQTNGAVYVYQPPLPASRVASATMVLSAPRINAGLFVAMPQAQVICFGSEATIGGGQQDPLLVRWSDVGSYSVWVASTVNQAGSFRLSRGSRIVGGIQAPQSTLLWTDVDCWSMQYVGPQQVYSFSVIGSGCGLMSPKARAVQGRNTYWMSPRGFFVFGDSGVQPMACPVWDTIFYDLNNSQTNKIHAWSNSTRHEIFFFYPSSAGNGEIDKYVKFNTLDNKWDVGAMIRTSGIDESVFGLPLAADANYRIQQHEVGFDADDQPMSGVSIRTGYAAMGDGTAISFVDELQPDLKWFGTGGSVNVTLYTQVTPSSPVQMHGPYPITSTTQRIPLRIRARQIAAQFDWAPTAGFSARIGAPRIRIAPSGRAP